MLDFGGAGSPILLLPGLGATAHSYDELAPLLAQKHRVVAMTRRGTGDSSKPDFGFDTPRLAQDVLQVMDAMGLEKVMLVGHSIAGDELTWLGGHHPERFSGLVYLDAAYDRSGDRKAPAAMRLRELGRHLPPEPPFPPEALLNFDAMTKMLLERGHLRLPEGELIAFRRMNDPYLAGFASIDGRTQQAISAAIQAPDYAAVKIPALAIYAFDRPERTAPAVVRPERQGIDGESGGALAHQQRHASARTSNSSDATSKKDRCWKCRTPGTTSSSRISGKCWKPSKSSLPPSNDAPVRKLIAGAQRKRRWFCVQIDDERRVTTRVQDLVAHPCHFDVDCSDPHVG